jgi:hypothetical protein
MHWIKINNNARIVIIAFWRSFRNNNSIKHLKVIEHNRILKVKVKNAMKQKNILQNTVILINKMVSI